MGRIPPAPSLLRPPAAGAFLLRPEIIYISNKWAEPLPELFSVITAQRLKIFAPRLKILCCTNTIDKMFSNTVYNRSV